jgi:hypothetical protein
MMFTRGTPNDTPQDFFTFSESSGSLAPCGSETAGALVCSTLSQHVSGGRGYCEAMGARGAMRSAAHSACGCGFDYMRRAAGEGTNGPESSRTLLPSTILVLHAALFHSHAWHNPSRSRTKPPGAPTGWAVAEEQPCYNGSVSSEAADQLCAASDAAAEGRKQRQQQRRQRGRRRGGGGSGGAWAGSALAWLASSPAEVQRAAAGGAMLLAAGALLLATALAGRLAAQQVGCTLRATNPAAASFASASGCTCPRQARMLRFPGR